MLATSQIDSVLSTTIDLLRHGVCEGSGKFRGSTDSALLPEGIKQMENALKYHKSWDLVVSSPLRRCREFAIRICNQRNITLQVDERWREIDFGQWEGESIQDIFTTFPEEIQRFYSQPESFVPPDGESILDMKERVVCAFNELLDSHKGKNLLVIQHGGTTRLLLAHILNMPLSCATQIEVPYACLTRIRVYHESDKNIPVLISHNPESVD